MDSTRLQCAVCGKRTSLFNYGVASCNACKMFFKRFIDSTKLPETCTNGGTCDDCRFCRYQKCVQAGMRHPRMPFRPAAKVALFDAPRQSAPDLHSIIQHLKCLDISRKSNLLMIGNAKASAVHIPNYFDWAGATYDSSLEFISRLQSNNQLLKTEQLDILRSSGKLHCALSTAMNAYCSGEAMSEFPVGGISAPAELLTYYKDCPLVLDNIKYPLVAKLRELRVTSEEFLFLSAIMVCNPCSKNLSDFCRNLVAKHQNVFSSSLMQYCLNRYQQSGPARYVELLSIFQLVQKRIKDFENAMTQMLSSGVNVLGISLRDFTEEYEYLEAFQRKEISEN